MRFGCSVGAERVRRLSASGIGRKGGVLRIWDTWDSESGMLMGVSRRAARSRSVVILKFWLKNRYGGWKVRV